VERDYICVLGGVSTLLLDYFRQKKRRLKKRR